MYIFSIGSMGAIILFILFIGSMIWRASIDKDDPMFQTLGICALVSGVVMIWWVPFWFM